MLGALGALVVFRVPFCPTALFFGVPCPGCGLTRATLALLQGDFTTALHLHPLVPVLTPLVLGITLKSLFDYVRGAPHGARSFWTSRPGVLIAGTLSVLVLAVWAARFAGFFGGPAPVESLASLKTRLFHAER